GEGDCVHYSYMFNDLASSAGIDSEVVSYKTPGTVTGHAFNSVVINNYKYFVDPLLDESCVMHINNNEDCPSHLLNAPHEHTPYSTVLGEWMTEQVSPLYQSINFKLNRTVDLVYRWFSSVECKSSGTYIYPEDDAIRDNNASVESSSIRGLYPYVSRRGSVDVIINSPDKPGCAPIGKYSCTYNIDSEGPTMKIQCVNIKTGICL
ncbi:MAG: transglutaminase domain-containing protein, partial [bacterium]